MNLAIQYSEEPILGSTHESPYTAPFPTLNQLFSPFPKDSFGALIYCLYRGFNKIVTLVYQTGCLNLRRKNNCKAYQFTQKGLLIARALRKQLLGTMGAGPSNQPPENLVPEVPPIQEEEDTQTQKFEPEEEGIEQQEVLFYSNDFDNKEGLVMLIDNQVREGKDHNDLGQLFDQLTESGVVCKTRPLKLGDFMWLQRRQSKVFITRNKKQETRNKKQETRNKKQETKQIGIRFSCNFFEETCCRLCLLSCQPILSS